jgi:trk system potassium uptake protein TrkA
MSSKKSYAVFGLGRYGRAVAEELTENGAEVLAIDIDEAIVNSAAEILPYCKCADVTDIEALRQLGIADIDTVVIAMGSSLEAGVMAVMLCKELGVNTVVVKCASEVHRQIMEKMGADKTVFPEYDSGIRLAKNLLSSGFVDLIDISDNVSLMELEVKPEWEGKSILDLNIRKNHSVNIVAIARGDTIDVNFDPAVPLDKSMKLIAVADKKNIVKLK